MSDLQFHPLRFNPRTREPFLRLPSPHENIIITPPRLSDAPAIVKNMMDPAVYVWLEGPPHPYLPKHAEDWLSKIKPGSDAALEMLRRASEEKPEGPPILVNECPVRIIREVREDGSELLLGDIMLVRERWPDCEDRETKEALSKANAARELGDPDLVWCIGDYLASSHHGKGIMTAAVRTLLHDWAIPRMGVHQIRVETFSGNTGSRRVFEKTGFVYEKTVPVHKVLNSGGVVEGMDILWWKASQ